ncbi:Hypothetical predicted protein [Olea europaea subsp. europaea]|uniref:Uncharacterized protein n=1 Tax=Olea europaea subsp. europaea TaxID=158383 RepID=A0A8S0PPR1_OLEEU|nr:Hypothetical predicted protein [Olea europaea subsp. europaea]
MFGMHLGHGTVGSFWDTVCRLCPGCDRDAVGFQAFLGRFGAFLGSFDDTTCRPHSGHVLATTGMQPDFQAFLGNLWARCVGHVQDVAILSGISGQFRDSVYRPCPRCVRAMAGTQVDFQPFLGSFWARCRLCPGCVLTVIGTQPDFEAFQGDFWGMVCRQCPGHVWAAAVSGTRCAGHERDASGPQQGCCLIFRHFWDVFGHGVQAMSGTRPDRRHGRAAAGMQPNFQAFLGHDGDASGPRQRCSLIFRHFWEVFGHGVHATLRTHRGQGRDGA